MVDKNVEDCGCAFLLDADGRPVVECSTAEEQDRVFQALRTHADINIRVAVVPVISVVEEADETEELDSEDDQEFDDIDESEDLDDLENQ